MDKPSHHALPGTQLCFEQRAVQGVESENRWSWMKMSGDVLAGIRSPGWVYRRREGSTKRDGVGLVLLEEVGEGDVLQQLGPAQRRHGLQVRVEAGHDGQVHPQLALCRHKDGTHMSHIILILIQWLRICKFSHVQLLKFDTWHVDTHQWCSQASRHPETRTDCPPPQTCRPYNSVTSWHRTPRHRDGQDIFVSTHTAKGAILMARVRDTQKPAPPVANQNEEFAPEVDITRSGEAVEVLPRYQGRPGSCLAITWWGLSHSERWPYLCSSWARDTTFTKLSSSKWHHHCLCDFRKYSNSFSILQHRDNLDQGWTVDNVLEWRS